MAMRAIAFVIIGLALGGYMQETIEPASQVGWNARDKQLMSNLPYAQASIPEAFKRHIVDIIFRPQQPKTPARILPGRIHIDQHGDDFARGIVEARCDFN